MGVGHFGTVVKLEKNNLTSKEVANILLLSWWETTLYFALVDQAFSVFGQFG